MWRDQWRAFLPLVDEPSASLSIKVLAAPSGEVLVIPSSPPKVHHEHVIKDDLVVRIDESYWSWDDVEWIDNPDGVPDY